VAYGPDIPSRDAGRADKPARPAFRTRDQAIGAVCYGGRVIFKSQGPPARLARLTGESFAAHVNRHRLEALCRLVDVSRLHPQAEAVLPLDQV
jgi:hypothetical protein